MHIKGTPLHVCRVNKYFSLFFTLYIGTKQNGNGVKNEYRPDPTRIRDDLIRNKGPHPDNQTNAVGMAGGVDTGGSLAGISTSAISNNGASHASIVGSSWKSPVIGAVAVPGTPTAMSGALGANKTPRGNIVIALYTYQGSEFGDMSFKKGDQMEILDKT